MPYKKVSTPQKKTLLPGIADVFYSDNVFINNVPVALWQQAGAYTSVALPEPVVVKLSSSQKVAIEQSTQAASGDPAAKEVGLSGAGEVPQEGPLETVASVDPRAPTASSDIFVTLSKNIDTALSEAKAGKWKETGSNEKIEACYKAVGYNVRGDSTPWCAAFVGSTLKLSGIKSPNTLSSLAYSSFGSPVDPRDKSKWRLNDIVVFRRQGGGHVGFFRGFNPSNGSVLIAGGNQSNNLTEAGFNDSAMPIVYVGRAWELPSEYDVKVTYSGSGSSVRVV